MTTGPLDWGTSYALPARSQPAVVTALTVMAVAAAMTVSAFMLDNFGLFYSQPGGNPLMKIHPMTYLSVLAFLAAAVSRGNPIAYFVDCANRFPGAVYFGLTLIVMIFWTLLVQHQPLTSLVDTYVPAVLLVFLIAGLDPRHHRVLTIAIHVFMCANAALGIAEVATGWRLTPLAFQGAVITWDWRASALLGHPLENAIITGLYLLMIAYGADRSLSPFLRLAITGLQMAGLVAFGGRTAMVLSYALVAVRYLWLLMGALRGKRFNPMLAAVIVMIVPVVIGTTLVALDAGVFDKLIQRFTDDGGSADTRVSIIRIFNSFPTYDLLMGPDPDVLVAKAYIEGTTAGIESFVFGFFLQSGIIISLLFFCGMAALTYEVWRIGSRAGLVHIIFFYIVAAGAASLSVKGQTMAQFVILFMTIEAMPALTDRDADEP